MTTDKPETDYDHVAYLKGWDDCIDWWQNGYHGLPDFMYPYSKIVYQSWRSGVIDANRYMIEKTYDAPI